MYIIFISNITGFYTYIILNNKNTTRKHMEIIFKKSRFFNYTEKCHSELLHLYYT